MRLLWEEFLSLEDGTVAGQEAKLPLFSSGKVLAPPPSSMHYRDILGHYEFEFDCFSLLAGKSVHFQGCFFEYCEPAIYM